jgi:hypothetical protein
MSAIRVSIFASCLLQAVDTLARGGWRVALWTVWLDCIGLLLASDAITISPSAIICQASRAKRLAFNDVVIA